MLRDLGILSSAAIGLIIAWAALHFDTALLVIGLCLLAVVTIAWVFRRPTNSARSDQKPLRRDDPSPALDDKGIAMLYLERARENGYSALENRSAEQIQQSISEIDSALRGVRKAYSLPAGDLHAEAMTYRTILKMLLQYIDSFYFLLKQGHIEQAKLASAQFSID